MGNLYCVENARDGAIWNYFDLGENIVCVNAVGENIQQRLNGCDYDSDTMLVTDDALLVETAEKYKDFFKVPVCNINAAGRTSQTLYELDHDTSENKIGEIVNLSQKLNSILWDELYHGADKEAVLAIYEDICKLAVLSGLEIDKAKRSFEDVRVGKELAALRKKYARPAPMFFREIDKTYNRGKKQYIFHNTTMDYIYKTVWAFHFRKGKEKAKDYEPISSVFGNRATSDNVTDYRHRDKIIEICDDYKARIDKLYMELRSADDKEREVIYERIQEEKAERDCKVSRWLTSINVMVFVIRHYEKNNSSDWRIYAPLINTELFRKEMFADEKLMLYIEENPDGPYCMYGRNFAKTL